MMRACTVAPAFPRTGQRLRVVSECEQIGARLYMHVRVPAKAKVAHTSGFGTVISTGGWMG